jgi:hypothetical protein
LFWTKISEVPDITYIDSDLCFFNDPELIYSEIGDDSIAITPHRFAKRNKACEEWGLYNVAFNFFRRDEEGLACLNWWRDRCIEWCYDRLEDGKFADQKYLDDWPVRFKKVKILDSSGINLAIWNVEDASLGIIGNKILVDQKPLIFYHFHGFKRVSKHIFTPSFEHYKLKPNSLLASKIYQKYAMLYIVNDPDKVLTKSSFKHPRESLPEIPIWINNAILKDKALYIIQGRIIFTPINKFLSKIYLFLINVIRKLSNVKLFKKYFDYEY